MKRQAIAAAVVGLALLAAPAADAKPRPCTDLRNRIVDVAIDYALERSTRDELAEVLSSSAAIEVSDCSRRGPRRARFRYKLKVVDDDSRAALVDESGTIEVTPRRDWVKPHLRFTDAGL